MGKHGADSLLWLRFQSGDKNAFTELVNLHSDILYGYGKRFSANDELIKDCIQDVFLTLWRRREYLSATTSIKFYLMKALRQRISRESYKWQTTLSLDDIPADETTFNIDLEEHPDLSEPINATLKTYISKLTPRQREIIYLRFYENLAQDEVAELMGLTLQSVYNLQHNALLSLKKLMDYKSIQDCLTLLCLFISMSY